MESEPKPRSGFVAIIGRPNSGKSTLLNALVGEKVAIVSDKPQTTRWRVKGILTNVKGQIVFIDTPGIHKPGYGLNRRMMSETQEALSSVDLVLLVVDASTSPGSGDRFVLGLIKGIEAPVFLLPNKIDLMRDKSRLLPFIERYSKERDFAEIIPISAIKKDGAERLIDKIFQYLPEGKPLFPDDWFTDQPERTLVAELVREKILIAAREEIPYVTAVIVERWEETDKLTKIHCIIYVEKPSERAIIIGKNGSMLKQIGSAARADIEKLLDRHVYLGLFVKVRQHWRDDERALDELVIGSGANV
ncbi:MAG TPA: GTPase Era [Blastocatellia bacterium]|nr:GTPase Era [Blastocatellia bacterium]